MNYWFKSKRSLINELNRKDKEIKRLTTSLAKYNRTSESCTQLEIDYYDCLQDLYRLRDAVKDLQKALNGVLDL